MENASKEANPVQLSPEELSAMQAAQGEALAAQEKRIAQLMSDLEAERATKGDGKVVVVKTGEPVKFKGKNYLIVHGVILEEGHKTPQEISQDKGLLETLITGNSSAIKAL